MKRLNRSQINKNLANIVTHPLIALSKVPEGLVIHTIQALERGMAYILISKEENQTNNLKTDMDESFKKLKSTITDFVDATIYNKKSSLGLQSYLSRIKDTILNLPLYPFLEPGNIESTKQTNASNKNLVSTSDISFREWDSVTHFKDNIVIGAFKAVERVTNIGLNAFSLPFDLARSLLHIATGAVEIAASIPIAAVDAIIGTGKAINHLLTGKDKNNSLKEVFFDEFSSSLNLFNDGANTIENGIKRLVTDPIDRFANSFIPQYFNKDKRLSADIHKYLNKLNNKAVKNEVANENNVNRGMGESELTTEEKRTTDEKETNQTNVNTGMGKYERTTEKELTTDERETNETNVNINDVDEKMQTTPTSETPVSPEGTSKVGQLKQRRSLSNSSLNSFEKNN